MSRTPEQKAKHAESMRKWRAQNPERNKEHQKKWRDKNKARISAYNRRQREKLSPEELKCMKHEEYLRNRQTYRDSVREYSEKHRDERLAYNRRYCRSHREELNAYARRYYAEHPERSRLRAKIVNSRRRARKLSNGGEYTKEEWLALCDKYGNQCLVCGKKEHLTPDHVVPLSRGGSNDIENIQPLCLRCNLSKGTQNIDYREGCYASHAS